MLVCVWGMSQVNKLYQAERIQRGSLGKRQRSRETGGKLRAQLIDFPDALCSTAERTCSMENGDFVYAAR